MSLFTERRWAIIPNNEKNNINYNQVLERDSSSIITNQTGSLSIIKWDGSTLIPSSIEAIEGKVSSSQDVNIHTSESIDITGSGISGSFKHAEILEVLVGRKWSSPITDPVV